MKYGVVFPQIEFGNDPQAIKDYAQTVEGLGYDYLLVYDHVLGAHPDREPKLTGPYTDQDPFHEPMVLFGFWADLRRHHRREALFKLSMLTAILLLALALVGWLNPQPWLATRPPPAVPPGGMFGEAAAARAEGTLTRLVEGLLTLQEDDGSFDPYPEDPGQPEIRRTVSHALATAALARAR